MTSSVSVSCVSGFLCPVSVSNLLSSWDSSLPIIKSAEGKRIIVCSTLQGQRRGVTLDRHLPLLHTVGIFGFPIILVFRSSSYDGSRDHTLRLMVIVVTSYQHSWFPWHVLPWRPLLIPHSFPRLVPGNLTPHDAVLVESPDQIIHVRKKDDSTHRIRDMDGTFIPAVNRGCLGQTGANWDV